MTWSVTRTVETTKCTVKLSSLKVTTILCYHCKPSRPSLKKARTLKVKVELETHARDDNFIS